jgi:uncharacterized protein YegL
MPKLEEMIKNKISGSTFGYSAVKPEKLEASEYTLVNIIVDKSGSVSPFENELSEAVSTVIGSCKKNPRVENILVRVVYFNHELEEVHGFRAVADLVDTYYTVRAGGGTALFDAAYEAIGSTIDYANILTNDHFMDVNCVNFLISDGEDRHSKLNVSAVRNKVDEVTQNEELSGTIFTILIGVNDTQCASALQKFKDEAGLDHYLSMGDATPENLAKLAQFVNKSISSASQSLASGTSIDLTF